MEPQDKYSEAANRLLGEVMNVLDILVPTPYEQFTIMQSTAGGVVKTQKDAAKDVIRTAIIRVFAEIRKSK